MKTVMCFGTFDNLHSDHLSYLKQARQYGDYLIVVVARDKNVRRIKGKLPQQDEGLRLQKVKGIGFINKVVLGQLRDKFNIIKKYKPDIVCLGYDQKVNLEQLRDIFFGKIIKLKPYKENIYKSSKLI